VGTVTVLIKIFCKKHSSGEQSSDLQESCSKKTTQQVPEESITGKAKPRRTVHSVDKKILQKCSNGGKSSDRQESRSAKTKVQITQSTPAKRQRSENLTSLRARPALPQQRVLRNFFGALLPQPEVNSSPSIVDSIELSTAPLKNPAMEQNCDLHTEVQRLITDPPTQRNAELVARSRLIVVQPTAPNSTPWIPGTKGLYPRPRGSQLVGSSAWQQIPPAATLWNVRVEELRPQEAIFQVADNLSTNAFYIAADDWTRKDGKDWGIGKRYGAFRSVEDFATSFLEISQNRCFYHPQGPSL
jgi:hypothetical protein